MKSNRIVFAALGTALIASIAVTGCKKKEEAAAPAPVAAAPATVAPAVAPAPATSFTVTSGTPKDKISVVIKTDASVPVNAELEAKLTFQTGQTAGDQKVTIKAEDAGTTTVDFTKKTPWPTGKYTATVTVNGTAVGTPQDIEIK